MEQTPSIGQIVIYRSRTGTDMPAIITQVVDDEWVHLHAFPPPGHGPDVLNGKWGTRRASTSFPVDDQTWRYQDHDEFPRLPGSLTGVLP